MDKHRAVAERLELTVVVSSSNGGLAKPDSAPSADAFDGGPFTTWEVRMARAGNRYGWRMVSATPQ